MPYPAARVSPHFLTHEPQREQMQVDLFSDYNILILLPSSHLSLSHLLVKFFCFKDSCDYIQPTIIQNNLPSRSRMLITFAKFLWPWKVTYSHVPENRYLKEPLSCLPQQDIISYFSQSFLPSFFLFFLSSFLLLILFHFNFLIDCEEFE